MATRKGFLDLPAELRNRIYEEVLNDFFQEAPWAAASTKRPGALIDRWTRLTYPGFYKDEMFQSSSAIIAANRQIHSEFYPMLYDRIVHEAMFVTVHILDFDFQSFMDWLSSLATDDLKRFQQRGTSVIQLQFDFERFTPLSETFLVQWLRFAMKLRLNITNCQLVMEYPQKKEWIRHGFSYPAWAKQYYDFVKSFNKSDISSLLEPGRRDGIRRRYESRTQWDVIHDLLRHPVEDYEYVEQTMWTSTDSTYSTD